MKDNYFRVIGAGGHEGAVARTAQGAWASWERAMLRRGYAWHEIGSARAAGSCRLVEATTRRAARDADVSKNGGTIGRGEWWRV